MTYTTHCFEFKQHTATESSSGREVFTPARVELLSVIDSVVFERCFGSSSRELHGGLRLSCATQTEDGT